MADTRGTGLQTIFGFFLGLMVTAFVGVGVYTFYPSPAGALSDRMVSLNRQEQAVRNANAPDALTPDDRARIQSIQDELARVQDESRAVGEGWGRRTSIILIAFATLAMGYVRFVRRQDAAPVPGLSGVIQSEGVVDLERRVRSLEVRMDEAASAFGRRGSLSK